MLTTASQFGPRARSLRTNHTTATATVHRVLGASGALTVQQCQQIRDFRFGSWFSLLDSEIQEKLRRHEQNFKQRHLSRGRYSDWDKHPFADDARHAVKRMMASYWLSHDARPCGRYKDTEPSKQRTSDNKDGVRPGQNIEDVERGAMEHLIFGEGEEGAARGPKLKRKRSGKKNKHNSVPYTFYGIPSIPEEYDDCFIDPVTNRRVAKHPAPRSPEDGVDIPVKTFKDYRTRFVSTCGAPSDESTAAELRELSRPEIETITEYPEEAPRPPGKPLHDNLRHNGHDEAQDITPKYDDLHKYKPVLDDVEVSSQRPQQPYNDLDKYKPVTDEEPVQFEDLKPPHEDLDKYNAAVVDEIVARFASDKAPHSDLHRYDQASDPVRPSEQDIESKNNDFDKSASADITAKRTVDFSPQEDLDNDILLKDTEPHGKPLGPQILSTKPGLSAEYQASVEKLEPGDFPPSTVEKLREKYGAAELRKYTAVRHVELEQNSSTSADEGITERPTEKYDPEDLAKYKPVYHDEPDGNPLPCADERVVEDPTKRYDPEDLAKYTPVYWHEPDGQPAAAADSRIAERLTKEYDPAELAEYKPVYWNEPDGQPLPAKDERAAEGLTKNYDPIELEDYERPVQWNEPDGQPSTTAEELRKKYADLGGYGPVSCKEAEDNMSGQVDAAKEGLEEMDARRDYESPDQLAPGDLDKADESTPEVLRKIGKNQQRLLLISQMKKDCAESDAADHEASLAVKFARARVPKTESERQFTGNYVRDFPEEFEKSWTETLSTAPDETAQQNDEYVFESQNMDGGLEGAFGRPSSAKIQPALDRHLDDHSNMVKTSHEIGNERGDSKSAQDLDNTYSNESGGTPTSSAHIKHNEDTPESADKGTQSTKPDAIHHESTNEPTLYKILAYDPTMQKIEIAETSSFVPDTASALTPADALLRLSHPTRFFPHFGPLQSEGYEIISGTGDVLVFRKVRLETRNGKQAEKAPVPEQSVPAADEPGAVETRINPIDMTGMPRFSPASANFASPTGYVNYENIPETAASKLPPPPPKIKYNIDVHREEPVFSGPKSRVDGKRGKKKGLGKRLIVGGVWVAGISYALGVVSEYL